MSDAKESASSGIGLGTVLFVVFLVMKLTGNVDWSWLWVTAPLWIPFAIIIGCMTTIALIAVVVWLVMLIAKRR